MAIKRGGRYAENLVPGKCVRARWLTYICAMASSHLRNGHNISAFFVSAFWLFLAKTGEHGHIDAQSVNIARSGDRISDSAISHRECKENIYIFARIFLLFLTTW